MHRVLHILHLRFDSCKQREGLRSLRSQGPSAQPSYSRENNLAGAGLNRTAYRISEKELTRDPAVSCVVASPQGDAWICTEVQLGFHGGSASHFWDDVYQIVTVLIAGAHATWLPPKLRQ